jgi:cyclohexanone monooxygenase
MSQIGDFMALFAPGGSFLALLVFALKGELLDTTLAHHGCACQAASDLILRSGVFAASRRMCYAGASWFETAHVRLLTMREVHSAWQNMQPRRRLFVSCAFVPRVECCCQQQKNPMGVRMSALQSVFGKNNASGSESYDVVVVGAGFAGMYMLHKLRGLGLSVRVYEQGGDVGGTWYWNRYPGARCDVESMQYSYSFSDELQQQWNWSERYAPQPEILRYANHVADRFGLRSDIQLNTRVDRAAFDEGENSWSVATSDGKAVSAKYVVLATGCLSNARTPDIKGLSGFKGQVYHTGHWPHEQIDFTGQRVGVIGTGSSGIQSVPVIAEQASHLTVFQRTANFSIPARNAALTEAEREAFRAKYPEIRRFAREVARNGIYTEMPDRGALDDGDDERRAKYEQRWSRGGLTFMSVYNNLGLDKAANDTAANFVREKIAEIVKDPQTAKLLQPNNHPIGSKRICVDTDYFAAFNRPNVTLVDIRSSPIEEITANAVRTGGKDYQVDALVLATGFDAMTGSVAKIDISGRNGQTLNRKRAEGPKTYLGLMSAGFPNLFIITGPGSPSVLSNMIVSIEQHVDWIADALGYMRDRGFEAMEANTDAEDHWVAHVNEVAHATLYPQANSWYMGANIPGKPQIFMPYIGGVGVYRQICDDVAAKGYEGFAMTAAEAQKMAASS